MMDSLPIFVLVELQANMYAINDALVKKGICSAKFLQNRKKFYENQIAESLKLLRDLQTGKINRDEAEEQIREISKHLVWDTDVASGALKELVETMDV